MSHQGPPRPPWARRDPYSTPPEPYRGGPGKYPPPSPERQPEVDEPTAYQERHDHGYGTQPGHGAERGPGGAPAYGPHPGQGYGQPDLYRQPPPYQPPMPQQGRAPGSEHQWGPPEPYQPHSYQQPPPYREPQSHPEPQSFRTPYPDSGPGSQAEADADAPTTQFDRPADLAASADAPGPEAPGKPGAGRKGRDKRQGKSPGWGSRVGKAFAGKKRMPVVAGTAVLVLLLAVGMGWYLTREAAPHHPASTAPVPEESPSVDVNATGGMRLAPSRAAELLFPSTLKPLDQPEHTREAVGETNCASVAASKTAKQALAKSGCKKVYLALYVDQKKRYAVTFGYIDVGSAAKAKKGANRDYGDYPKYNSWFRFLIPEGSKITSKTRIFTYVSSEEKYVTFGTCAYYDGRNAKKELDEPLTREAIAVGVAIMFS